MTRPRGNLNPLVIQGAIAEIKSRPDMSQEAKDRGIRSLLRAQSRLLAQKAAESWSLHGQISKR